MNWTAQTSGTVVDLNGVSFVDAKHGWAVGAGGLVLHTDDGGASWITQKTQTSYDLLAVSFPSLTFGCAVGYNGTIATTADGGRTWRVTQHMRQGNWTSLFDVHFVDPLHGWACGAYGAVIVTTDGGATWRDLACPITQQVETIHFVDPLYGWAAGFGGSIVATQDGGAHWKQQATGSNQLVTGIRFADRQRGFAIDGWGTVWATSNGGQRWQSSYSPNAFSDLVGLDLAGSQGCCAVGGAGLVLATANNGATWGKSSTGTAAELRAVDFVDAGHGWVVGAAGTILRFAKRPAWHVGAWTREVAIDPMALVLPNSVYVKWAEGKHPHTPEQLERFVRDLQPAELQVVSMRAAELRDLSEEVQRVASQVARETETA